MTLIDDFVSSKGDTDFIRSATAGFIIMESYFLIDHVIKIQTAMCMF